MKAYKEKKANEPVEKSPEAKPTKKGSVKEFFGKKEDKKKSSPRKSGGGESQKFKSAEFVDTDDSSSEDEEKVRCPVCRYVLYFTITAEIPSRLLANIHCQQADRHMNL